MKFFLVKPLERHAGLKPNRAPQDA